MGTMVLLTRQQHLCFVSLHAAAASPQNATFDYVLYGVGQTQAL